MKKSALLALILIIVTGTAVFADLADTMEAGLRTDFQLLMEGIGKDIVPVLQQNALAGQGAGMAELGDSVFYIGILPPTISATVGNGFLTFRNDDDYFEFLPLGDILNDMALTELEGAIGEDLVNLLFDQMTPFPTIKLNAGVKLPLDLELHVHGMWLPQELTSMVVGLIPSSPDMDLSSVELSALNVGGVVRYPLLKDSEMTPAFSIGAGYYYDSFHAGIGLGGISEITTMLSGAGVTLDPAAGLYIDTSMSTFGIEAAISKKLLFFVPYAKLGAWYAIGSFSGRAVITDAYNPVSSGAAINDMSFIGTAGFELLLGPFILNLNGNYNLGSGVWGASIASRLQF